MILLAKMLITVIDIMLLMVISYSLRRTKFDTSRVAGKAIMFVLIANIVSQFL